MASEVEKRLEEIEAYVYSHEEWKCDKHHKPENLKCEALWLCARLRDALEVIEALHIRECPTDLLPLSGFAFIHARQDERWTFGTCGDEAVVAAHRRLFGEEEKRG